MAIGRWTAMSEVQLSRAVRRIVNRCGRRQEVEKKAFGRESLSAKKIQCKDHGVPNGDVGEPVTIGKVELAVYR